MDQYQSWGQLLANFQRHWSIQIFPENKPPGDWSIQISPEIHMDQWLPNLPESSGLNRHRSIECSSLFKLPLKSQSHSQPLNRTDNLKYLKDPPT